MDWSCSGGKKFQLQVKRSHRALRRAALSYDLKSANSKIERFLRNVAGG
jgi:hypothetical protein